MQLMMERSKTQGIVPTSLPAHENIYTLPNILTFSRLLAAPVIGYLTLYDHHVAALALFVYAGATDLIDGWIARKWNLQTVVGTVIDPMADKTLMTVPYRNHYYLVWRQLHLHQGCRQDPYFSESEVRALQDIQTLAGAIVGRHPDSESEIATSWFSCLTFPVQNPRGVLT
ncbi:MAG: hypothetical protein Q9219_002242 [cf. Caloplaca sp. 3 TL-2023]